MPNSEGAPQKPPKRALVVEDQTTVRELLCELLADEAGYEVEASASGADAKLRLARGRFDLVLLDLVLPDMHGFELLGPLDARASGREQGLAGARVVVLTAQARPAVIKEALQRGVHAVVTKGAPLRELREAIARVSSGGIYYSTETSRLLHEASVHPERDERLTERQREVLRAVASGLSTKEIAARLSLSEKTVANHRARIMERLGVHDVAGLTRHAMALGLVDPET